MRRAPEQGILPSMKSGADRLRAVVDAVIDALDDGLDGRALAVRAMLSPFHFNRLVRAGIGEPPAAFRRRLLLERAAWRLGRGASVTDAGLEAGYDAIEAFSRAFTRAVGRIRDRNEWDDAFVDALCTPPVSFTFGSVIAHILTVSVVRRQTVGENTEGKRPC